MTPEALDIEAIEVPTLHETVLRHTRAQPDRPEVRFHDRVLSLPNSTPWPTGSPPRCAAMG